MLLKLNLLFLDIIMFFFICMVMLLGVAFLTLLEHYLLGLSQDRMAPNIVFIFGLFQPLIDGLKLMGKEMMILLKFSFFFYFFIPFFQLFYSFLFFYFLLFLKFLLGVKYSVFFLFFLVGFFLYFFFILSYFSESKYSVLGAMRSCSQSLSFDIIFIFFLSIYFYFYSKIEGEIMYNLFLFLFFFFIIFLLFLVEMNRSPFDFSEGESELVSGYNLELGTILFVGFFLAEYLMIFFYSFLLICFVLNMNLIFGFIIFFLFVLTRAFFPRFRLDFLMSFFWFFILFLVFFLFFILFFIFI